MNFTSLIRNNKSAYILALKIREVLQTLEVKYLKGFSDDKKRSYISKLYKKRTGMNLDWNNLVSYTEKMQWLKLYDATNEKTLLADKYEVRNWVKNKIGEEYLVPLLGVWNDFDEICFDKLPNKFVLKVTNGSGANIIVRNKVNLNMRITKTKIHYWMHVDKAYLKGFEMHYTKIKPRIIAETFIDHEENDLPDYKFLCFNGEVLYCWIDTGRYHKHKRNIYDLNWNLQPWNQYTYGNTEHEIEKPANFDKMVELAGKLCKGFSHVRVDFYNVNGKIYFGEMTFTNGSGFEIIIPQEYNVMLGSLIKLPNNYTESYKNSR